MVENRSRRPPARANMRATTEGGRNPKVREQPAPSRHRSRPLSQTVRPLARAPPTQVIDGRNRSHRAPTPICVQNPRGPKSLGPVTACAVAPSLSATLPQRARHPVHSRRRFSMLEICSFDRPRQYAWKHRCDRMPKVRHTARAVVPSLSHTHSGCARRPAHSRRRFSMLENLSHRPPTPTCIQASV